MTTITLLTDFGTRDYYMGAVRGTLLRLAPGSTLVDVTHEVEPGDVEEAAFLLAAVARWYPAGSVHYAVVDPGVGSDRGVVAAQAGGSWFVAPDNGLLTPILDGAPASWEDLCSRGGQASESPGAPGAGDPADTVAPGVEVRKVARHDLYLPAPGATFHGRDRFAPVAAFLARGEPFAELGPVLHEPVRLPLEPPRAEGEPPVAGTAGAVLRGRVVHVDRFGNLVTDLPTHWLGDAACEAEVEGHRTDLRVTHYAELPADRAGILPGSLGTLELSLDGLSLARRWSVARGARVVVRVLPTPAGEDRTRGN